MKQAEKTSKSRSRAKLAAAIFGCLGFILALATPFMPIKQQTATINWPKDNLANVVSPLIAYAPSELSVQIPGRVLKSLPKEGGVILSTAPKDGRNAALHALFITATEKNILIYTRNTLVGETSRSLVENKPGVNIIFTSSTVNGQFADFTGIPERPENLKVPLDTQDQYKYTQTLTDYMITPQLVGIFTDLPKNLATTGISVKVTIDTRFDSTPHPLKQLTIYLGILTTLIALISLAVLDRQSGHRLTKWISNRWKKLNLVDWTVITILVLWLFIGVNTSDDGYQFTMERMINSTGYMPNYFRWLGVPEDPVGWYYHIFAWMQKISLAALWMRVPALVLGIFGWLLISKEAIPRLGTVVAHSRVALWAGAMGFLTIWLPYNNGSRPETLVTVLMLLSWVLAENAIATRRTLPIALALLVTAFSFGAAPGGMVAIIGIIVCFRRMLHVIIKNCQRNGIISTVMPILAAGTFYLFVAFADQTLAGALEASRVKYLYGPSLNWWEELVRYYYLMIPSVDGALPRRFGVLILIFSLFTIFFILLRRTQIRGINRGVLTRFVAVASGSILFMTITPTKWTHHFGLFATMAGVTAAICSYLVSPVVLRSRRNRLFFTGLVLIISGVAFTGINSYWFMGNFGQPWTNCPPNIGELDVSVLLLWLGIITLLVGGFYHLKGEDSSSKTSWTSPFAIILTLMVLFEIGTTAYGAIKKQDSFSWAIDNYRTLRGNSCGLADEVLMEPDPNIGMLNTAAESKYRNLRGEALLKGAEPTAFSAQNVPPDATKEAMNDYMLDRDTDSFVSEENTRAEQKDASLLGKQLDTKLVLPFNLREKTTPVIGSFLYPGVTQVTSHWYALPAEIKSHPLLVVTAAGNIHSKNYIAKIGAKGGGEKLVLQYAQITANDQVTNLGTLEPIDIGPTPAWRNLRFPTKDLPADTNAVRIVASDNSVAEGHWLAFTPPRIPKLVTLNKLLGKTDPILIDWAIAIAFPCQQPMGLQHGILQQPTYRISPDHQAKYNSTDTWQSGGAGGGILGPTELYLQQQYVATYMRNNWDYDWGYVTKYTPLVPMQQPELTLGETTRTGWWKPGRMRAGKYSEAPL